MNALDRIITALTPGTAFNTNGLLWRSIQALSQFAGCSTEETLELIAGQLSDTVVVRPSKTGKGLLAAISANIPEGQLEQGEVMSIAGGNAFNPLTLDAPEPHVDNDQIDLFDDNDQIDLSKLKNLIHQQTCEESDSGKKLSDVTGGYPILGSYVDDILKEAHGPVMVEEDQEVPGPCPVGMDPEEPAMD